MAIVRESATQDAAPATSATVSLDKPATLNDGDVLTALIGIRGNKTVTVVPTGWVLITSNIAGTNARVYAYYKIITNAAGEPATYEWTLSGSDQWNGGIGRYSGVDTSTVLNGTATNSTGTGTAASVAALTTTVDGCQICAFIAIDASTSTTIALTAGDAVAERWDAAVSPHNEYDDGPLAAAGSTTSIDWTLSASTEYAALLFALVPLVAAAVRPQPSSVIRQAVQRAAVR